jgi:hypothetical protein
MSEGNRDLIRLRNGGRAITQGAMMQFCKQKSKATALLLSWNDGL